MEDVLEVDNDSKKAWTKSDRQTPVDIGLSLFDEHLDHVSDALTAREMVNAILNGFKRHTLKNMLASWRTSYTVVMYAVGKTLLYFSRIKQLTGALRSTNCIDGDNELL